MPSAPLIDYQNPDYLSIFRRRTEALERIRQAGDREVKALKDFYRQLPEGPIRFINDWGMIYEPRNIEIGLPARIPFILFPKQEDWIRWVIEHWRARKPGLSEKSRDCGISWTAIALSCHLCLFIDDMAIGFGSQKADKVDQLGNPDSLFEKGRLFLEALPIEFRGGWTRKKESAHMRLTFPETNAHMIGEAGDNVGRGGRTSIYLVDEAAHLQHPTLVDAALANNTNCRMDVTSVKGMANTFAQKRHSGKIDVFTFHWRDDPRKDEKWHQKQVDELGTVIVAQEIDIDYHASAEGVLIPSRWVQAAIDADKKLGFEPVGAKSGALDVADEGIDLNAFCGARGVKIEVLEEWSGKGDDIYGTVLWAFALCDEHGYGSFRYDADGLGAGVRGDARVINESRNGQRPIKVLPFRGSGEILHPEREDVPGRRNEDFFLNFKAQSFWSLRRRFQTTYRAVVENVPCSLDDIIVIPSTLPLLNKLVIELSQPTYGLNNAGKLLVDKKPDGTRSPNLADAVNIRFSPMRRELIVSDQLLSKSRRIRRRVA